MDVIAKFQTKVSLLIRLAMLSKEENILTHVLHFSSDQNILRANNTDSTIKSPQNRSY